MKYRAITIGLSWLQHIVLIVFLGITMISCQCNSSTQEEPAPKISEEPKDTLKQAEPNTVELDEEFRVEFNGKRLALPDTSSIELQPISSGELFETKFDSLIFNQELYYDRKLSFWVDFHSAYDTIRTYNRKGELLLEFEDPFIEGDGSHLWPLMDDNGVLFQSVEDENIVYKRDLKKGTFKYWHIPIKGGSPTISHDGKYVLFSSLINRNLEMVQFVSLEERKVIKKIKLRDFDLKSSKQWLHIPEKNLWISQRKDSLKFYNNNLEVIQSIYIDVDYNLASSEVRIYNNDNNLFLAIRGLDSKSLILYNYKLNEVNSMKFDWFIADITIVDSSQILCSLYKRVYINGKLSHGDYKGKILSINYDDRDAQVSRCLNLPNGFGFNCYTQNCYLQSFGGSSEQGLKYFLIKNN